MAGALETSIAREGKYIATPANLASGCDRGTLESADGP